MGDDDCKDAETDEYSKTQLNFHKEGNDKWKGIVKWLELFRNAKTPYVLHAIFALDLKVNEWSG